MKKKISQSDLFVSKEITHSPKYSNQAIAVYCVLKLLTLTNVPLHSISPKQIAFYLNGSDKQPLSFIYHVKDGLDELIEKSVITKKAIDGKNYIIDCSNIMSDLWNESTKKFTIISYEEVQKIFSIEKQNNFSLLRYFIYLADTFSSSITVKLNEDNQRNRVIGNMPISFLAKIANTTSQTIIEYNKILEKNKLIYIYRHDVFVFKSANTINQLPNIYGRYSDKKYVDKYAKEQLQYIQLLYINKSAIDANKKRKLAQMYNRICMGESERYDEDEILEVYQYIVSENKKYKGLAEKTKKTKKEEFYLDKIRDLTIFEKYKFYQESWGQMENNIVDE